MLKPVYLKLAWETLKKNYRISVPFVLDGALMEAIVYSIASMADNPDLMGIRGYRTVSSLLPVAEVIMIFFSFLFYLYLNSVLSKNRKQEQGLYTVLGMGKGHLIRILFYQYLILTLAIMVCGLAGGILFDKAMNLLYAFPMNVPSPLGFHISPAAVGTALLMTLVLMALLLVISSVNMLRTNPLELLKGEKIGERPPKNRWILAVLGLISLGIGYWLAVTIKDPVEAIFYFFVAVLFVIIGTYLLFLFGFSCLIRLMERNKRYYYNPRHFISVSTMKYRIKASAASLASITVLSTAVLVAVSASASLIYGSSTMVDGLFPQEANLYFNDCVPAESAALEEAADQAVADSGMALGDPMSYRFGLFLAAPVADGYDRLNMDISGKLEYEDIKIMTILPETDFNRIRKENLHLENGEVYAWMPSIHSDEVSIEGKSWKLKQMPQELTSFGGLSSQASPYGYSYCFVVMNDADFASSVQEPDCSVHLFFDLSNQARTIMKDMEAQADPDLSADEVDSMISQQIASKIWESFDLVMEEKYGPMPEDGWSGYQYGSLEFKEDYAAATSALFSGVLFIGIYVSVMFAVAVILIMYYKQISEGTDDRKRFAILQNVGLEQKQIRRIINDQVILIFFVPLGMAALHLAFAFPMLYRIQRGIGMVNLNLFILVTVITFVVFALLYVIAYRLTARTYYRMVRAANVR